MKDTKKCNIKKRDYEKSARSNSYMFNEVENTTDHKQGLLPVTDKA